ncbi:MAG: ATP-binding protein [Clostridiales bacterium]|nr:ATP-binding protein [Clostridiales bacterium]
MVIHKTIVVDCLDDLYQYCREYVFVQLGISHEDDEPLKATDMINQEFLTEIQKLLNLKQPNIILISHEKICWEDPVNETGKIVAIKPNLKDCITNEIADMVDSVGYIENDCIVFKGKENVFSGTHIRQDIDKVEMTYEAFNAMYEKPDTKPKQPQSNTAKESESSAETKPIMKKRKRRQTEAVA